ncbi:MAG: MFS transporter [Actinomycetota bacterium]
MVASATFLSTYTAFGVAYSFGSFFGPMADEFGTDRGATALFFAITTFLYFALGVVSGHLADVHGPRPVLIVGGAFLVVGLLATSQVNSITLGYLTYGVGVGVGVACLYVPMVAAVGGWFERQRTTALGVAVAGIGVGTLTGAPATEWLIEAHGWRRTYVILAVVAAVLLTVAAIGARRPPAAPGPAAGGRHLRRTLRTSRPFWLLYLSMVALSVALFVPLVFLPDYVATTGADGSAGWLVGLIGISSVLGRLGLGALAGRVPAFALYLGSYLVLSLSFGLWLLADGRYGVLLAFAVVMGVSYGGFIALAPAVTAERFGIAGLGAVLGALYTAAGIGGLFGPPLIGRLIDDAGYTTALVVAMGFGLFATLVLVAMASPGPSEPEPSPA